jgi:hypothetical protein
MKSILGNLRTATVLTLCVVTVSIVVAARIAGGASCNYGCRIVSEIGEGDGHGNTRYYTFDSTYAWAGSWNQAANQKTPQRPRPAQWKPGNLQAKVCDPINQTDFVIESSVIAQFVDWADDLSENTVCDNPPSGTGP